MNKQIKSFAYDCVLNYSKFDSLIKQYVIEIDYLPDFVQEEFSFLIMSYDKYISSESTGFDNDEYEKAMLPSLLKLLSHSSDKDNQIEFIDTWKKGVVKYSSPLITSLLNEAVADYNIDQNLVSSDDNYTKTESYNRADLWQ